MQVLEFMVGNQMYAIDLLDVVSIEDHKEISEVPLAGPYTKGMVIVRDQVLPVFNLASKLCVTDFDEYTDAKYGNMLLVVEHHQKQVAMEITMAKSIVTLEDTDMQTVPQTVKNEGHFIKGLINRPEGLLIVLDKDLMLAEHKLSLGEPVNSPAMIMNFEQNIEESDEEFADFPGELAFA